MLTHCVFDDEEIYSQVRMFYAQANVPAQNFGYCSDEVKLNLFRSYCTSLYSPHLWCYFKKKQPSEIESGL